MCSFVLSCSVDLKDENTTIKDTKSQSKFVLEVRVSGELISSKSETTEAEEAVGTYDIYVFDVATDSLEYNEKNIVPKSAEAVEGSPDYKIDSKEITLPTSGAKEIILIANGDAAVSVPEINANTTLTDFEKNTTYALKSGSVPASPFVMIAKIQVSGINGMTIPLALHRAVGKLDILNGSPDIVTLSSVTVKNAADKCALFSDANTSLTVLDYPAFTSFSKGEDALLNKVYLLPSATGTVTLDIQGTYNGNPFSIEKLLTSAIYSDYEYKLTVRQRGTTMVALLEPDFDGSQEEVDPIVFSGNWLSADSEVTLPFTAEPNYGFVIKFALNVDGTPSVSKVETASWYDAKIESDTTIRIKTLESNDGSERVATIVLNAGKASKTLTVKQQGLSDVGTVTVGGIRWMDRNIGAVLPANMANALDVKAFGYYYQWGRNVPFPAVGEVKTTSSQMAPSAANASDKFISWTSGTEDWNSNGIEGSYDTYWESVSSNPCPTGYRLPTYMELSKILPYRLTAMVMAAKAQNRNISLPDGSKYAYSGYGSNNLKEGSDGNSTPAIYGIVNKGTDDAYYIRWQMPNTGGTVKKDSDNGDVLFVDGGQNYVMISTLPGNSSSAYSSLAAAISYWSDNASDAKTIYFPCAGRYNQEGVLSEAYNSAFYWTGSMYKGNKTSDAYSSGLLYFRPAAKYMLMYAPAFGTADVYTATESYGYRSQGMPIRCVKE